MSKSRKHRNPPQHSNSSSDRSPGRSSKRSPASSGGASRGDGMTSLRSNVVDLASRIGDRLPKNTVGLVSCFAGGVALGLGARYLTGRAKLFASPTEGFFDDDRPVIDVMTEYPAVCTPATPLTEVARLMVDWDCGAIPVVEEEGSRRPVGILTDRDIVVRTLAENRNPMQLTAGECMTPVTITAPDTATVFECIDLMQDNQIRRLVVVDEDGSLVGIVAQADIALELSPDQTQELVGEVSAAMGTTRGPAAA